MTYCFPASMVSASCDACDAQILEAREHDELVAEDFFDRATDNDEFDVADY